LAVDCDSHFIFLVLVMTVIMIMMVIVRLIPFHTVD